MNPRFALADAVPPAEDLGAVHFIGVGGVGMSGIARVMLARGLPVSGSDAKDVPVLAALRALGGQVHVGFDPARLDGVGTVVAGSAIREDNPELSAARARGLRVLHRSQALEAVMKGRRVAAVAGTNGKTTTSSMLTVALQHAQWDPSFAVGGELTGAGTNAHDGTGAVFVAEADESDSSFLVYSPEVAIVTNVQPDHLDHYGTVDALEAAFAEFAGRVLPGGVLVACADDRGSADLARAAANAGRRVLTFGESLDADVRVSDPRPEGGRISATLSHPAIGPHPAGSHRLRLAVPGWHNALDAAAAFTAAVALGLDPAAAVEGLESFTGTRRRFERRGEEGGVRVYDDYAHNPAKVDAAVRTGRQVAASGKLVVVFQPHLYTRTLDFAAEFGAALGRADEVLVMDVYAAREDPVAGVSGALVHDRVDLPEDRKAYLPSWSAVAAEVVRRTAPGDLVLTVGAGDVTMIAAEVLGLLAAREAERAASAAGRAGGRRASAVGAAGA